MGAHNAPTIIKSMDMELLGISVFLAARSLPPLRECDFTGLIRHDVGDKFRGHSPQGTAQEHS